MSDKFQSIMISAFSALAALFLLYACWYEYTHGEFAMAVMVLLAMLGAVALSWYTRKPYKPRIRFKVEGKNYRAARIQKKRN